LALIPTLRSPKAPAGPISQGNILWDCTSLIDEPTIAVVKHWAVFQPSLSLTPTIILLWWSGPGFDAPIYLHAADSQWVVCPDPLIHFWEGETQSLAED
jgi:hypothetical protein